MAKFTVWNLKVFLSVGGNGHLEIEEKVRVFLRSIAKTKFLVIQSVRFNATALRGKIIHTAQVIYTTSVKGKNLP